MSERVFQDYKKHKLSASHDGRGIKVAATASPGTFIHRALSSMAQNEWDEIWLRAINTSGAAVKLTLEWGGTTAPDDQIEITIPGEDGFHDVVLGHMLQNGKEVRAFAATGDVIVLHGYVNRYAIAPNKPPYWQRVMDVRPDNLLGYWRLNELEGATALDTSGNGRQGAYTGVTLGDPGMGDGHPAAGFDGVNDFVDLYSDPLRDAFNGPAGTILIWAKANAAAWTDGVAESAIRLQADSNNYVNITIGASNLLGWLYAAGGTLKYVNQSTTTTAWMCLAITWDKAADQVKAYFNGVQEGATQAGLGTWTGQLQSTSAVIGAGVTTPSSLWDGSLAHAALWSVALTAAEIAALANAEV